MREKLSVYEKIIEQIKRDIALGILMEGDKLPSCRELAFEMGINPNTVQRAYTTLEELGVITSMPKKGVYVSGGNDKTALKEAEKQIRTLKAAGLTKEQLEAVIASIYSEEDNK